MPQKIKDFIQREWRNVGLSLLLVALLSVFVVGFVREFNLSDGTIMYIMPVLVAATRWGVAATISAALAGLAASAFFFYPPLYSFMIKDFQAVVDLSMFVIVSSVTSLLAYRLKQQADAARQREIDMRDLYAFSRRLAVAFDVSDIHAAIEDHLATVMQRKVVLFATARDASASRGRHDGVTVPDQVLSEAVAVVSGERDSIAGVTVKIESGDIWLVRAVSPKSSEFGVIAINLGRETRQGVDELRTRVDAVLADATATLERLGVAHAINEARMRSQTDQLREAIIGSVSHALRTPLASILGAATVLSSAPALEGELKLKALAHDVRDEAERLNNDIQNLLDASRISSDGVNPHTEWADPADIINSAIERCRRRFGSRRLTLDMPTDLPLVHVDPVLVQQALVQIFDNAVKYSPADSQIKVTAQALEEHLLLAVSDEGVGLTAEEKTKMWGRFFRGERNAATTSGSGLGLWIASAFIAANAGKMTAFSDGPDRGATLMIELPVAQAAVAELEAEADE